MTVVWTGAGYRHGVCAQGLSLGFVVLFLMTVGILTGMAQTVRTEAESKSGRIWSLEQILSKWKESSLEDVAKAAEGGDLTALHYLGYYHAQGIGGTTNYALGLKYYTRAAEQGFPNSMLNIGGLYRLGQGVPLDLEEAVKWSVKAGENGHMTGYANAGRMVIDLPALKHHAERAREWLETGAFAGSSECQVELARFLLNPPKGGSIDMASASYMLRKAYYGGNSKAAGELGDFYRQYGNAELAAYWYQKGADMGDVRSEVGLAWLYFEGSDSEAKKGTELMTKLANKGDAFAQRNLGIMLSSSATGRGKPDYKAAAEWLRKAVAQEDPTAAMLLARLYLEKQIEGGAASAAPYLRKAAKTGHAEARLTLASLLLGKAVLPLPGEDVWRMVNQLSTDGYPQPAMVLAERYRRGDDVPVDFVKASRYYFRAQGLGQQQAQRLLQVIAKDNKVPQEVTEEWRPMLEVLAQVRKALQSGDGEALFRFGQGYDKIEATPEDVFEASLWYGLANDEGHAPAKTKSEELRKRLPESRAEEFLRVINDLRRVRNGLRGR